MPKSAEASPTKAASPSSNNKRGLFRRWRRFEGKGVGVNPLRPLNLPSRPRTNRRRPSLKMRPASLVKMAPRLSAAAAASQDGFDSDGDNENNGGDCSSAMANRDDDDNLSTDAIMTSDDSFEMMCDDVKRVARDERALSPIPEPPLLFKRQTNEYRLRTDKENRSARTHEHLLETPQPLSVPELPLTELQDVETPPVCLPAPLVVVAKKLGVEIRSRHRRRSRSFSSSTSDESGSGEADTWGLSALRETDPIKQTQEYWRLCYGEEKVPNEAERPSHTVNSSFSAQRAPPAKSCLSAKKRSRYDTTPRLTMRLSPRSMPSLTSPGYAVSAERIANTPTSAIPSLSPAVSSPDHDEEVSSAKKVHFTQSSAAEYQVEEAPNSVMKTLSQSEAASRYPIDRSSNNDDDNEQQQAKLETEQNTLLLEEWDAMMDDDDDSSFEDRRGNDVGEEGEGSCELLKTSTDHHNNGKRLGLTIKSSRRDSLYLGTAGIGLPLLPAMTTDGEGDTPNSEQCSEE